MIKRITANEKRSQWLSFGFLFLFFLLLTYRIASPSTHDDPWFLERITEEFNNNYFAYLKSRYDTWTSRVFIELMLVFSVKHFFVWRLLNSLAMTIVVMTPAHLFKVKWPPLLLTLLSFGLFLLIPTSAFNDAGWVATSTNYIWVLAAGCLSLLPLARCYRDEKNSWLDYTVAWLALFYACNQEQMAGMILLLLICFVGLSLYKKKSIKILLPYFLINFLSLAFILTNPGSKARTIHEMIVWYLGFESVPLLKKAEMGYASTLRGVFLDGNLLTLVFLAVVLALLVYHKRGWRSYLVIGYPLAVSSTFGFFVRLSGRFFPKIKPQHGVFFSSYDLTNQVWQIPEWAVDILAGTLVLAVLLAFYLLLQNIYQFLIPTALFMIGLATKMVLGFSPTVFAAGLRTYTFFYGMMIVIIVYLINEKMPFSLNDRRLRWFYLVLLLLLGLRILQIFLII